MFWKRKKNDFISLGLNTFDDPVPEQAPEPVVEKVEVKPPAPVEPAEAKARVVEERPTLPIVQPEAPRPKSVVVAPPPPPIVKPQHPAAPPPIVKPQPSIAPVAEGPAEDEGFMKRFRKAIASTRENISTRLEDAVKGKKQIDATPQESHAVAGFRAAKWEGRRTAF